MVALPFRSFNLKLSSTTLIQSSLAGSAALYILLYSGLVWMRIQYPFELEWQEGAMVEHALRVTKGQPIYLPPHLDFVPFIYPPLYLYVSGLIAEIVGIGFFPLRLVSVVSSAVCLFVIFQIVRTQTKNKLAGLLASSLFAATYRLGGAWLDIARVDSLFLALFLLFVYVARFGSSNWALVLGGSFLVLSALTKQTALIMCLPILAYCLYLNWQRGIVLLATFLLLGGAGNLIFNIASGGWYFYYIFYLPRYQDWLPFTYMFDFWLTSILLPLPIAGLCGVFWILLQVYLKRPFGFWLWMLVGMLGGAFLTSVHSGSYQNDALPAYAALAILFGIGFDSVFQFAEQVPTSQRIVYKVALTLLIIIQFALLRYNPLRQIPTQQDLESGENLLHLISQMKGQVFIPRHGFLGRLAGKGSYAHALAITDVLRSDSEVKNALEREIEGAIRDHKFDTIIMDSDLPFFNLTKYYKPVGYVFEQPEVFYPVTGFLTRPEIIYVAKSTQ